MPRLYYTDPLLLTFVATVTSSRPAEAGRHRVTLDQTAFYPTSGGQPFDTGRLGGIPVVDVIDEEDGTISHVLEAPLGIGALVTGEIDAVRRRDHMQQHTGQHILSAAFDGLLGVRTVSFHLGAETATIDLAREVTANEIERAGLEANRIVWEDRPVTVRFVSAEEAASLPLRKDPTRTGELRLVDITDFDLSACGGTHVPRTGMVGLIGIAGWERFKGATRLTFVCGGRALAAYHRLRDIVGDATRLLSVGQADLSAQIARTQGDLQAAIKQVREQQAVLARYQAAEWAAAAETIGPHRVVLRAVPGAEAAALKALASALVTDSGLVVVLVGDGSPAPVVVGRAAGVEFDASGWLKSAIAALGGRGGGRPEMAQGGLTAAPDAVVAWARQSIAG